MNVAELLKRLVAPPPMTPHPVRPDPGPPPSISEDDMRWARLTAETIVRRARALDIDVELERRYR